MSDCETDCLSVGGLSILIRKIKFVRILKKGLKKQIMCLYLVYGECSGKLPVINPIRSGWLKSSKN